jgi:hypothetical protein
MSQFGNRPLIPQLRKPSYRAACSAGGDTASVTAVEKSLAILYIAFSLVNSWATVLIVGMHTDHLPDK